MALTGSASSRSCLGSEQLRMGGWLLRDTKTGNTERQVDVTQDRTLRSEQRTKNSIQRRHVDAVFRVRFYTRQTHHFSDEPDRREERDVRVSRSLDLKACLLEHASQLRQAITAAMIANLILQAPQKHKSRHKQESVTAGPEHAIHFAQPGKIVVHVFHHVE